MKHINILTSRTDKESPTIPNHNTSVTSIICTNLKSNKINEYCQT